MLGLILRLLITALGLALASVLIPGAVIHSGWSLVGAAILLGLVNAVIRPLVVILTLPFTLLTLGLFLLVINAAMVALVAWLLAGFSLSGFWSALFTSVIVSIVSWVGAMYIGPEGRVEVMIQRR